MVPGGWAGVLLDYAQDVVVLLDESGDFEYVNAASERLLGYDPAALEGDNAFSYIHEDEVSAVIDDFQRTIDSDDFTETSQEFRFRAADGGWRWLEARMSNLTDEALDGFVVSARDITDRVAAERSRAETAARLDELAAVSGDVLWMFDGDWSELLFVNPAYETVYGQPVERLRANTEAFLETVHPDDQPRVERAMDRLAGGTAVDMEYRVNEARNYGVWVWVQGQPILEDGEVVRITGFTRDVTDRRRREQQLLVLDNLLRHNIRNDLTKILGNVELIERAAPETTDRTAVIRRTCDDLLETAEKERDIIDVLTTEVVRTPLEVAAVLAASRRTITDRFPAARVDIDCPNSLRCLALQELEVAVTELLENAVRHGDDPGATVRLTGAEDGEDVRVSVADAGPPLPDIEARVLTGDPQMDDLYHSSGLGLWLVHWIVELSNGRVSVTEREDGGNRIVISLPRIQA